jgi:hypothetical protein
LPKNETAKTTPIASAFENRACGRENKKLASESHAGKKSVLPFLTRFLYGEVAKPKPQKRVLGVKIIILCGSRPGAFRISEPPGEFCIEQAPKNKKTIGGSKSSP